MTALRIDLTVLADLAASMFAACFMILLIFLSLAQQADAPPPRPIEATTDLHVVARRVQGPGALVDLLHAHAGRGGTSIDIFADRVDVLTDAGSVTLRRGAVGPALASALEPVRLYVFSNTLYHDVVAALGNRAVMEMSVPHALQDANGRWRTEFLSLEAEGADLNVFRERLAQLLEGGTEQGAASGGAGGGMPAIGASLLERMSAALALAAALGFPLAGLAVVVLIERGRLSSGQSVPFREHS